MNGFGFVEYKDAMDARDVVPGMSSPGHTPRAAHADDFITAFRTSSEPCLPPSMRFIFTQKKTNAHIQTAPTSWESALSCNSLVAPTVPATLATPMRGLLHALAALFTA